MRMPASTSATRSIRARTFSTARPSRCSSTRSEATPAATSITTRRTSCCSSSTISNSSTSITSASRRSTSRTPSSTRRAAGRLFGLPGLGRPRRTVPVARRRTGRFFRHLLEAHAVRLRQLGGSRMGVLPEASRGRRGRRGSLHPAPSDTGDREGLRRFRRRHDRQEAAARNDGDLSGSIQREQFHRPVASQSYFARAT